MVFLCWKESKAFVSETGANHISNNRHADQMHSQNVTKPLDSTSPTESRAGLNAESSISSPQTNSNQLDKKHTRDPREGSFIIAFPRFTSAPKTTSIPHELPHTVSLSSLTSSSNRERFFPTSDCDAQVILQERRGSIHSPDYPFSIPVKHHHYERDANSSSLVKRNKCSWIISGSKKEDVITIRFVCLTNTSWEKYYDDVFHFLWKSYCLLSVVFGFSWVTMQFPLCSISRKESRFCAIVITMIIACNCLFLKKNNWGNFCAILSHKCILLSFHFFVVTSFP